MPALPIWENRPRDRQPLRIPGELCEEPEQPGEPEERAEREELRRTALELKCDVGELRSEVARIARSVQLVLDLMDQARSAEH